MAENDKNLMLPSSEPEWQKVLQRAWGGIKKVSVLGAKKSKQISLMTRHQLKRSLLYRNRNKLFMELGEMTYHLLDEGKLSHEDLQRSFERIKTVTQSIREESQVIEDLRTDSD